jgi:hypothetical protein
MNIVNAGTDVVWIFKVDAALLSRLAALSTGYDTFLTKFNYLVVQRGL